MCAPPGKDGDVALCFRPTSVVQDPQHGTLGLLPWLLPMRAEGRRRVPDAVQFVLPYGIELEAILDEALDALTLNFLADGAAKRVVVGIVFVSELRPFG